MAVISRAERDRIFGPAGHVDLVTVVTPWGIKTTAHRLIAAHFLAACRDAYQTSTWKPLRIDSYNPRPIRGTEDDPVPKWSMHSWALAWDFFATPPNVPPPGGVWTPDNPVPADFAHCFVRRGFRWGAEFSRVDLPHIEWPGGLPSDTATEATPVPHHQEADDVIGTDQLDDRKATIRAGFRSMLLRNPNDQAELDVHVLFLARSGYEAWVQMIVDSAEGKAALAAERRAVGL